MPYRKLFPGHFVDLDVQGPYEHYVGGELDYEGGDCPNCRKPFVLHLTLDLRDPQVKLDFLDVPSLPLVFCQRCEIGDQLKPMVYRVHKGKRFELVDYRGDVNLMHADDWYRHGLPDVFPKRAVSLRPIPDRLQELFIKANTKDKDALSKEEDDEVGMLTGVCDPEGNPLAWPINLVGGIAFFLRSEHDYKNPRCADCGDKSKLGFVAALINTPEWMRTTGERRHRFVTNHDGYQMVFFCCPECGAIHVDILNY